MGQDIGSGWRVKTAENRATGNNGGTDRLLGTSSRKEGEMWRDTSSVVAWGH
jgi:hypothetical protein